MRVGWKQPIRNKRKYAIQFAQNRTPDNFELKKKHRETLRPGNGGKQLRSIGLRNQKSSN